MLYGSDIMPMLAYFALRFQRAEMEIIIWMCGVSMNDRKTSEELRNLLGVEPITTIIIHVWWRCAQYFVIASCG